MIYEFRRSYLPDGETMVFQIHTEYGIMTIESGKQEALYEEVNRLIRNAELKIRENFDELSPEAETPLKEIEYYVD